MPIKLGRRSRIDPNCYICIRLLLLRTKELRILQISTQILPALRKCDEFDARSVVFVGFCRFRRFLMSTIVVLRVNSVFDVRSVIHRHFCRYRQSQFDLNTKEVLGNKVRGGAGEQKVTSTLGVASANLDKDCPFWKIFRTTETKVLTFKYRQNQTTSKTQGLWSVLAKQKPTKVDNVWIRQNSQHRYYWMFYEGCTHTLREFQSFHTHML